MKKYNITDEKFPMSELVLDINQFDMPNVWRVDFSKARENYVYEDVNGQRTATDSIRNMVVPAFDNTIVSALEKLNVSVSSLKDTEIEFVGDFVNIQKQKEQESFANIKLIKPQIKLKTERVNKQVQGIKTNEWATVYAINSVKIVAEGMQLIADE